jgi:DNA polymerase III gamma/tau subunit
VYWVAFAEGGEKEAEALADQVAELGQDDVKPQSVDAYGKLSTTWADIKNVP